MPSSEPSETPRSPSELSETSRSPSERSESRSLDARPAIQGEADSRVALTPAAAELLRLLVDRHGPLMFHQSGGCCDGSSPMCFPVGDFLTSDADVLLGTFDLPLDDGSESPVEFWMSAEQFALWRHTHLTLDVVPGRGAGFSVEAPEGKRFLIRSRILN
ncbi:DUF779 domain-containing protein [Mariniluteicoccus flavus]